jgi:hypothetical protein
MSLRACDTPPGMRRSFAALVVLNVALLGCDPPTPPTSTGGAASSAPASSSAGSGSAAVTSSAGAAAGAVAGGPAAPENLDVAALQKALKCATDAKSGPCGVLARFSSCTPWNAVVPSGDGRWLGHGYVVEGEKVKDQITLVRSRRVPTNEVGPGQVPAKISVTEIPKEEGPPFSQADRAIRAFERTDIAPRGSPTIEFIKRKTDWPEFYATPTTGGQVYLLAQAGGYLCQGPRKQLLVIQRAATRGSNADGVYAELWATTW